MVKKKRTVTGLVLPGIGVSWVLAAASFAFPQPGPEVFAGSASQPAHAAVRIYNFDTCRRRF